MSDLAALSEAGRIRPLSHRLLVKVCLPLPSESELAPGLVFPPARDHLPTELPHYVRRRLIRFLKASHIVPPRHIENILPRDEALEARRVFRRLTEEEGLSDGDALLQLGIVAKFDPIIVPGEAYAKLLAAGCDCHGKAEEEEFLISSYAGEPIANRGEYRVIWCREVIGVIPPRSERAAARVRSAERERLGFAALRVHSQRVQRDSRRRTKIA